MAGRKEQAMSEQKHNGKLGDGGGKANEVWVAFDDDVWRGGWNDFVQGIRLRDDDGHEFGLTSQQSLELLKWLDGNKETLKHLAEKWK
jgi:hypothetical protein